MNVISPFLAAALGGICRSEQLASSLVGTVQDVRELVAHRMGEADDDAPIPVLASGWRAKVIGKKIDDLLSGQLSIRIDDTNSEEPLVFEPSARNC